MSFGYGMNENQNHLVAEGRTTSRVTNEPGGKSSVQLSWDSPEKSNRQTTAPANQKEKESIMKVVGSSTPTVKPEVNDVKLGARTGGSGVSSNIFAQGSRMNTGNYITDRPTSRVTQPPGGRSSISFY
ncbi:hypothetical protein HJC23_012983 [Cyclotella cryptica]|uniref:Microtubule-associated protein Jupiter n=1 Tax=Cyclotella cryptica TaxID=29204 RepID=A0ABD3QH86_9STRA